MCRGGGAGGFLEPQSGPIGSTPGRERRGLWCWRGTRAMKSPGYSSCREPTPVITLYQARLKPLGCEMESEETKKKKKKRSEKPDKLLIIPTRRYC